MAITIPGESPEYREARNRLLEKEIELRRAVTAVAEARSELPPGGPIPEDYVFDGLGPDGKPAKVKLSELFAPGKDSLLIYHFMFPRYPKDDRAPPKEGATAQLRPEEGPCPSCSAYIDQLNGVARHVEAAGFNFAVVAKTTLGRLTDLARDRGWDNVRFLSAAGNTFKRDYHTETEDGSQLPLFTVFHRYEDGIRHFWSSELAFSEPDPGQDARPNDTAEILWNLFDLTPEGRPSDWMQQMDYDCCHGTKPERVSV
jgi:predicted dithiol-disulfide oxidoreductase (DUF899 family)